MAQPKLKNGDTVLINHETEMGGCFLECTVIRIKGKKYIFQVQIPFMGPFEFEMHESELELNLSNE